MRLRRRLSYANVTATLALFLALGGGAWALRNSVGSRAIRNNSIRTEDIHKQTLRGRDVAGDSLRGPQVNEGSLDASAFTGGTGAAGPIFCDPNALGTFIDCASAHLRLPHKARTLLIATGGEESVGGPAEADCRLLVDGQRIPGATAPPTVVPGEATSDNTDATATNGFTIAAVSHRLGRGDHEFAMGCDEGSGDVRIDNPNIAVVMIGSGLFVP